MTPRKFNIEQYNEVGAYLQEEIRKAAERALVATAHRVVAEIVNVVIPRQPRQPVDRGAFRAGWRAKKVTGGAEVTNVMPYASIIEWGARSENIKIGKKMIDALTAWVLRKGLVKTAAVAGGKGAGARRTAAKAKAQDEARKMAWAIAQSMKKRGIFNGPAQTPKTGIRASIARLFGSKPKGGMRVLEQAMSKVESFFEEELKRELHRG